jgi:hypothetical protein
MPRPRTKGATIPVQLPISTDDALRAHAAAVGVSPGLWIERLVVLYLKGDQDERPACTHRVLRLRDDGVRVCKRCDTVVP